MNNFYDMLSNDKKIISIQEEIKKIEYKAKLEVQLLELELDRLKKDLVK